MKVTELSSRLVNLRCFIPKEFARKPRTLNELMRWKATEFRQIVLYTGCVVLNGILSTPLYDHFLVLVCAIRILICPQLAEEYADYANDLLHLFVRDSEKFYGKDILVYNTHSLLHLAGDVKNLGPLDSFSCFPYENKLGELKKLIRKPQFPIQQVVNRMAEKDKLSLSSSKITYPTLKGEHHRGPLPHENFPFVEVRQFEKVQTLKWHLSISSGNNCILTDDGKPAIIRNIIKVDNIISLVCNSFLDIQDVFQYPLPSSKLQIFHVTGFSGDFFVIPLSTVVYKCFCVPKDDIEPNSFIIQPILH